MRALQVPERRYLDPIDLLRCIGTLSVFFLHVASIEPDIQEFFAKGGVRFLLRTPAWSAVWIFFVLSGYLAGKSWSGDRYACTPRGALAYYARRFQRVILPVFMFILFVSLIAYPEFSAANMGVFRQVLTLTYWSYPRTPGISATWYVFTLAWMYIATPFMAKLLSYLKARRSCMWGLFLTVFILTQIWRVMACNGNLWWEKYVYMPAITNMDLYLGGMVLAYDMHEYGNSRVYQALCKRVAAVTLGIVFLVVYVLNCYLYDKCWFSDGSSVEYVSFVMCCYWFQAIWLVVTMFYLAVFDNPYGSHVMGNMSYVNTVVSWFASISFEFYLVHSMIANKMGYFIDLTYRNHAVLLAMDFVLSCVLAVGFHRIFEKRRENT